MTAKLTTLTEAIKTDLDAAVDADEFSRSFTTKILRAQRNLELAKGGADDLVVSIAPLMYWKQLDAAREQVDQCVVDVIVRQKIHLADQDADNGLALDSLVDDLVAFVDELVTWFLPGGEQDGRLDSLQAAVIYGADEEDDLPTVEVVINWNRIEQGMFEAYFPLHYMVS